MYKIFVAILIAFYSTCCFCADAPDWKYFKAAPNFYGEWTLVTGIADVKINNETIEIEIYKTTRPQGSTKVVSFVSEIIRGTVDSNGNIRATDTVPNSDVESAIITGNIYKKISKLSQAQKQVGVIYETIILNNNYMILGFTRRLIKD